MQSLTSFFLPVHYNNCQLRVMDTVTRVRLQHYTKQAAPAILFEIGLTDLCTNSIMAFSPVYEETSGNDKLNPCLLMFSYTGKPCFEKALQYPVLPAGPSARARLFKGLKT